MGNMSLNNLQEYYQTTFSSDFQTYFIVERSNTSDVDDGVFRVLFVDRRGLGRLELSELLKIQGITSFITSHFPAATSEQNKYFVMLTYYTAVVPQVICKVYGKQVMYAFHKASTWPIISCGLGGIMHPRHILLEADLLYPATAKNSKKILEANLFFKSEALPFFKNEIESFLSGGEPNANNDSYKFLINACEGKRDTFWSEFDNLFNDFNLCENSTDDQRQALYYLDGNDYCG
jgi:hypothetical protein